MAIKWISKYTEGRKRSQSSRNTGDLRAILSEQVLHERYRLHQTPLEFDVTLTLHDLSIGGITETLPDGVAYPGTTHPAGQEGL